MLNDNENQVAAPVPNNPYAAPTAAVIKASVDPVDVGFNPEGNSVGAGSGAGWVGTGWELFKKSPGVWILIGLMYFGMVIGLSLIPFIGSFMLSIMLPVLMGGWYAAAAIADRDEPIEFTHGLLGFQEKAGPLFTVGAIYAGLSILISIALVILAVVLLLSTGLLTAVMSGNYDSLSSFGFGMGLALLVFVLIAIVSFVLLYMAVWLAPALVMFHNLSPADAMKKSFFGSLKNFGALFVYVICAMLLSILGMLPLFLGLLVTVPILMIAGYAAYKEIFTE